MRWVGDYDDTWEPRSIIEQDAPQVVERWRNMYPVPLRPGEDNRTPLERSGERIVRSGRALARARTSQIDETSI